MISSSVLMWFVLNNLVWATVIVIVLAVKFNTSVPRIFKSPPKPDYSDDDLVEASNEQITKAFADSNKALQELTPKIRKPADFTETPIE